MKLVIRQYLASLKERDELDALLPDLLSQIGLNVFLKPGLGGRQFGVDVGAYGKMKGESEPKVYLFSVKSGDLDRKDWDSGKPQDLRPSIVEIMDVFIPTRVPDEYKNKNIEICLCFGGEVKEEVRSNVTGFMSKYKSDSLSFSEWNGDRLASLIERHLLREELLPDKCRGMLRKSLAMIDEPEVSFLHFGQLVRLLTDTKNRNSRQKLTAVRQLYLCLWILYAWCREENNLESAYLSSELSLLNVWDVVKSDFYGKNKNQVSLRETWNSINLLYLQISATYLDEKIIPHVDNLYALSHAVNPMCSVDVNLKLFDVLGRLAVNGFWIYWALVREKNDTSGNAEQLISAFNECQENIKALILSNPILATPYKDDQAIDLILAVWLLSINPSNWEYLDYWLSRMTHDIYQMFKNHDKYPTNIQNYSELIEHPVTKTTEHQKSVTKGSVLYPYISTVSAMLDLKIPYENVKKIREDFLMHCNFQVFFFDSDSEEYFYRYNKMHGAVLSHVCVTESAKTLIDQIESECEKSKEIYDLSAYKASFWPVILIGCRHYRLPVPINFIMDSFRGVMASKIGT